MFDLSDDWELCRPSDNVHCAYHSRTFSSLGCQTVQGGMHDGLWATFQSVIRKLPESARIDYLLVTGAECSISSAVVRAGMEANHSDAMRRLVRLRSGSEGDEVKRLQSRLKIDPSGYFGATTKKALIDFQRSSKLPSDGIYSAALDATLGWGIFISSDARDLVTTLDAEDHSQPPAPPVAPIQPAKQEELSLLNLTMLRQIAPRPKDENKARIWDRYVAAITSAEGARVLSEYGVDKSPQRLAYILANMLAETGGLSLIWESMAYSAEQLVKIFGRGANISLAEAQRLAYKQQAIAERVYGLGNPRKARQLGNTQLGDGWRYRGGGFLQTTGRDNYRTLGRAIGADLEAKPELIEDPLVSLKAACAEWQRAGLNGYADRGAFKACCNGINIGNPNSSADPNGYDDRLRYLTKARKAFGLDSPREVEARGLEPKPETAPELGDFASEIEALQRILNEHGYDAGEPDGVFTATLRDALLLLQARHDLPTTGRPDPGTQAVCFDWLWPSGDGATRDIGAQGLLLQSNRRYRATIRLTSAEAWLATNALIEQKFLNLGFREAKVTGGGMKRQGEALWPGPEQTVPLPLDSHLSEVSEIQ